MPNYTAALTAAIDTASFPILRISTKFLRAEDRSNGRPDTVLGPSAKEQVLK